jgi:hypothetical protein
MLTGKLRLVRTGRLRLALQVGELFAHTATARSLGALASVCVDDDCASLLNASATAVSARGIAGEPPVIYGASLVERLSGRTKLMLEFDSSSVFGERVGVFSYGLRFYSGHFSGDLGMMRPVGGGYDGKELPLGLPFVSFAYRN